MYRLKHIVDKDRRILFEEIRYFLLAEGSHLVDRALVAQKSNDIVGENIGVGIGSGSSQVEMLAGKTHEVRRRMKRTNIRVLESFYDPRL